MSSAATKVLPPFSPLADLRLEDNLSDVGSTMVVAAYSPDCGHDADVLALYERLAWMFAGMVRFFALNVQQSPGRAFQLGIWRTPAIVLLSEGMTPRRAKALDEESVRSLLGISTDELHLRPQAAYYRPADLTLPVRPAQLRLRDTQLLSPY